MTTAHTNRKVWNKFKEAYEGSAPAVVPVTGVTMAPKTVSVAIGGTSKLTGTVAPANATNKNVTYTSSDAAKVTVAANGTVTVVDDEANVDQTVTITATSAADGTKKDTCVVTITAKGA